MKGCRQTFRCQGREGGYVGWRVVAANSLADRRWRSPRASGLRLTRAGCSAPRAPDRAATGTLSVSSAADEVRSSRPGVRHRCAMFVDSINVEIERRAVEQGQHGVGITLAVGLRASRGSPTEAGFSFAVVSAFVALLSASAARLWAFSSSVRVRGFLRVSSLA